MGKDAWIVEVGPSFSPLVPKRDGWNTLVVNHASRYDMIEKYHDQTIDRIEEVDFVSAVGSLADAVAEEQHGSFDAFVASDVIEHTTDIVTFLRVAETLQRPDGVVILAVPDKRKCFDLFRHPSATVDAIAAFLERRDRHTVRRQRSRPVLVVLDAVLNSLRFRPLDRKRFKALVVKAARDTPDEGPEAARQAALFEETQKVLSTSQS